MSNLAEELIHVEVADTDDRFNHVFLIRTQVFVDEESIDQEDEYDGFDHLSTHYLATYQGTPAGTARRRRLTNSGKIRLERFAVLKEYRRKGIGTALAKAMISDIPTGKYVFVHAQVHAVSFFESLGFVIEGESFEEAGIQHIEMVYQASV
ncbi:MAG: GNAT family N-acetyltransferase [Bacteroidota bacterium]